MCMQIARTDCRVCGRYVVTDVGGLVCPACSVPYHAKCLSESAECPKCGAQCVKEPLPTEGQAQDKSWIQLPPSRKWFIFSIPVMLLVLFMSYFAIATDGDQGFLDSSRSLDWNYLAQAVLALGFVTLIFPLGLASFLPLNAGTIAANFMPLMGAGWTLYWAIVHFGRRSPSWRLLIVLWILLLLNASSFLMPKTHDVFTWGYP